MGMRMLNAKRTETEIASELSIYIHEWGATFPLGGGRQTLTFFQCTA